VEDHRRAVTESSDTRMRFSAPDSSDRGAVPSNFHHAAYLPGHAMAERCDLMVHHGGHSSVMTGLSAGTPAVIIPTITERESNARRVVALGAGEIVLPMDGGDGEKHIDVDEFSTKVQRVLGWKVMAKPLRHGVLLKKVSVSELGREARGARNLCHCI
jgi:hypothetical protein